MYGFGGFSGLVWVVVSLVALLFVVSAVALVYALRSWRPAPGDGDSSPQRMLDMRLAGGDIDVDEYRRIHGELERRGSGD